jgi:hypothetical protein
MKTKHLPAKSAQNLDRKELVAGLVVATPELPGMIRLIIVLLL